MSVEGDRLTPLARAFRNLGERLFGSYYEGPAPPARIERYVEEFARTHGTATRGEWVRFAKELARGAYKSGWTRGFEFADRDLDRRDPNLDPDRLAHQIGHDWEWPGGGDVEGEDEVVPEKEEAGR